MIRTTIVAIVAATLTLVGCGGGSDSPPLTRAECSNLQMAFNGAMYLVEKLPPGAEWDRRMAEARRYDDQMRDGGC